MENNFDILPLEHNALLEEFMGKIKDKSIHEILPILMEFKQRLPQDKIFTTAEKNAIIEQAMANVPEEEKNSYKSMLKILKFI